VVESFEGEVSRINERLAEALADVEVATPDAYTLLARRNERGTLDAPWNPGARSVAEDYVFPFIESVRGRGVDGAYLGAIATAYLQDPSLLDANKMKLLTDVVVQWARRGDGDLDVLRAALLDLSEKTKSPLRNRQIGDVNLANAMASQGAAHRMLVEADARGLTRSAADARAANTYLDNLNGTGQVGGRAEASRGRQVMANLLVPESYRRPLGAGEDIEDVSKPLVPARTEPSRLSRARRKATGGPTDKALKQEEALREAAADSLAAPAPAEPSAASTIPRAAEPSATPASPPVVPAAPASTPAYYDYAQHGGIVSVDALRKQGWEPGRAGLPAGTVSKQIGNEIHVIPLDLTYENVEGAFEATTPPRRFSEVRGVLRPARYSPDGKLLEKGLVVIDQDLPPALGTSSRATVAAEPRVAPQPAETPASPPTTFTTAKGSTYEVHPDGTTTRVKAARPEHPGDEGLKERSVQTFYVTQEDANKLAVFQTHGGSYRGKHIRRAGTEAAVFGTNPAGKVEGLGTSRVQVQTAPAAGLLPVELWDDGKVVHFGNPITEVRTGAPVAAEAAVAAAPLPPGAPGPAMWRSGQDEQLVEVLDKPPHTSLDGRKYRWVTTEGWELQLPADELFAVEANPITEVGSTVVAEAASEATRREAAVQSMTEVLTNTEEVLEDNVFVPRAVRDALARQVDAVIATARIDDDVGTLIQRNFWKQAVVLGVVTSKPNQTVMDFMGDVWAVNQRLGPIEAGLVAGRSIAAQFLTTWGAAQVTQLVDKMLGQKPGKAARDLVAKLSMTPQIDAIFSRSADVRMGPGGKYTALEVHDIWRAGKVFESYSAGQLTRTTAEAAYLIFGDTPFGKAKAAYFANQRALQEMANLAATRRRLAVAYGLLEVGHTPESAVKVAVKISGDFSGELHPIERGWFSTVFPFWAYRRFNARRTATALTNPFWLTRGLKAQEGGAAMASWYLDDSDEYGFHTESMHTEPDAKDLDALRTQVHTEHPEWDIASPEAEAMVQERQENGWTGEDGKVYPPLPRAIVRYERLVKKLRAMPYDAAKKEFNENDPEWRWLAMYHADDPVRGMLPEYAQDRYAVFVQENRNQAVDSWYRKGVGRTERDPNEQRYWLLPNDPHIDGLAELMAIAAIGSVAAGALMQDDVDFAKYNRTELLNGVFRDPLLSVAGFIGAGDFTPAERQYGKVVPDWAGEILFRRGLAVLDTEQDRGEDVLQAPETKRGAKYVIPPTVINASSLLPQVAPALLGSIELAIAGARLTGDPGKAGPRDALDRRAAVVEGLFGPKLQTVTPVTQDLFARKDAERRVKGWVEDIGPQQALDPSEETLQVRSIRGSLGSPTFQQEVRIAKSKMAGNQTLNSQDFGALRAYLVSTGLSEEQARVLSNTEVVARINATR